MTHQQFIEALAAAVPDEDQRAKVVQLLSLKNILAFIGGAKPSDKQLVVNDRLPFIYEIMQGYDGALSDLAVATLSIPNDPEQEDPRIPEALKTIGATLQQLVNEGFQNFNEIQVVIPKEKYLPFQIAFFQSIRQTFPVLAETTDDVLGDIYYTGKNAAEINAALEALGVDINPVNNLPTWQLRLR